jgi:hypothetical protein
MHHDHALHPANLQCENYMTSKHTRHNSVWQISAFNVTQTQNVPIVFDLLQRHKHFERVNSQQLMTTLFLRSATRQSPSLHTRPQPSTPYTGKHVSTLPQHPVVNQKTQWLANDDKSDTGTVHVTAIINNHRKLKYLKLKCSHGPLEAVREGRAASTSRIP